MSKQFSCTVELSIKCKYSTSNLVTVIIFASASFKIIFQEYFIKLYSFESGWSIVYIEGSKVILSKSVSFLSLTADIVWANNAK